MDVRCEDVCQIDVRFLDSNALVLQANESELQKNPRKNLSVASQWEAKQNLFHAICHPTHVSDSHHGK